MGAEHQLDESFQRRWFRRSISICGLILVVSLLIALSPLLFVTASVLDLVRRSRFALCRFCAMLFVVFGLELIGVIASFALWIRSADGDTKADLDRNFRLQCWWVRSLLSALVRLFSIEIEIDGLEQVPRGRFVLLMRHVSIGDTLLPTAIVSAHRGARLRFVLKKELLWDPCLDIIGQRLPNAFVGREATETRAAIDRVRALAEDLGERDAIILYPEGTRFSEARRARIIEHATEAEQHELLEEAKALEHILPMRLGGLDALLRADTLDLVICGHAGFEGVRRLSDLWNGRVIGSRLVVRFWRHAASEIPPDDASRRRWLFERWRQLDRWVADQSSGRRSISA